MERFTAFTYKIISLSGGSAGGSFKFKKHIRSELQNKWASTSFQESNGEDCTISLKRSLLDLSKQRRPLMIL